MTDTHEKKIITPQYDHVITRTLIVRAVNEPEEMSWYKAMEIFGPDGTDKEWRLPTRSDLAFMYDMKDEIGGFGTGVFWSSSENTTNSAWYQNFRTGNQNVANKRSSYGVRCVRRF